MRRVHSIHIRRLPWRYWSLNCNIAAITSQSSNSRRNFGTIWSTPGGGFRVLRQEAVRDIDILSDDGTYVSSHFRLEADELETFLARHNIVYSDKTDKICLKLCPTCPPHKNLQENMWKLYVWKQSGNTYCHRCATKHSWFDFKRKINGSSSIEITNVSGKPVPERKSNHSRPDPRCEHYHSAFMQDTCQIMTKFSELRGLSKETFEKYQVGAAFYKFEEPGRTWRKHLCITFPWIQTNKKGQKIVRLKVRSVQGKQFQRLDPSGGCWGLFGFHLVPASADTIVLTEGEFDAMAVYQATGRPAASLPNGAGSLPVELLPSLERFKKIYLWMDDDIAGQEGAETFAKKLGRERCYIVHSSMGDTNGPKDANEALLQGKDLEAMIEKAKPLPHKQITTFDDLRSDIKRELLHPEAVVGVQSSTLPSLNRILKGHRRGELTVLTGTTGIGKTTVLSQISLDYALQGVVTLWGSFEIKNHRLAKLMLSQYSGKKLVVNDFDYYADKFESLPMYFLKFFGASDVDQVLDAMDYAVYFYDVQHVVLDNLQFLMGSRYGRDKFDIQDRAIEKLRAFATSKNVHVTLVIHPRKEADGAQLGLSSIFGSAKASQEADNVIVVQYENDNQRAIQVKKNRFSGDLGSIKYEFDYDSRTIRENFQPNNLALEKLTSSSKVKPDQQNSSSHPSTPSTQQPIFSIQSESSKAAATPSASSTGRQHSSRDRNSNSHLQNVPSKTPSSVNSIGLNGLRRLKPINGLNGHSNFVLKMQSQSPETEKVQNSKYVVNGTSKPYLNGHSTTFAESGHPQSLELLRKEAESDRVISVNFPDYIME